VYYLRRREISHGLMMEAMVWLRHGLRRRRGEEEVEGQEEEKEKEKRAL
jgi:hypothetical protein